MAVKKKESNSVSSRDVVRQIYDCLKNENKITRSIDCMAYTEDFEMIFAALQSIGIFTTRNELYIHLMKLRKAGKISAPRSARKAAKA